MTAIKPAIPKITKPALAGISRRARLFRRLDEANRRHAIVWVSAPAGSGKTTLAASWVEARGIPCLWYQLDARDADPAAFFYYLREAVRRLALRKRETLPLLTPEYALGVDAYARNFFEKIGERLPRGGVLVFDNYQDLPEGAALQALLPAAVAALPTSVRIVVLSRSSPPPAFARLMAGGELTLLTQEEMNLTVSETRAVARARQAGRVSAVDASNLHARTGGWVAGTVLLLEAPTRVLPARCGAETTEQQVLFDYFAAEIFDRAPPEMQRLLLVTALLPEVDVPSAAALADAPHAADILADLVRRNYFTFRLAGARPRYRFHPLFREFLLTRARKTLGAATWRAHAERAADLLVEAGRPDDAAALLVGAGSLERLAQLIPAHAPALARQGRLASLEGWLRALDPATVESSARLSYWFGVCRSGAPLEARKHFERAYRMFQACDDVPGILAAWAGLVATFFYVWNDFWALDPWIAEMEELRQREPAFPSVELEARVTFGMLASLMWRAPTHPSLEHWLERADALLDSDATPELRMQLANYVFFYWVTWRGNCDAGDRVLERVRPVIEAPDVTPLTQIFWYTREAHRHARKGDHAACFASVERGLAIAEKTGVRVVNQMLTFQGIYGGFVAGDLAAARSYHERARKLLRPSEMLNAAYFHQLGAWIGLCERDIRSAERCAHTAMDCAHKTGAEIAIVWGEHTLAHILIERGEHDEAVAMLERCLAWARRMPDPSVEHHAALSIAYARLAQGRIGEAVLMLRDGLRIGREHGYLVQFWIGWRKDVMAKLAALALEEGIETEHVLQVIAASGLTPPDDDARDEWPWPVRVRMLGDFEVWRSGERAAFGGKTRRRPLELLRAMVALGGEAVPEQALSDMLWPDADGDAAAHALETTVYRLRKLLGSAGAVIQRDRCLTLDPRTCWVDALEVSRRLARALALVEPGQVDPGNVQHQADRILALYRGPFLPPESNGADWAEAGEPNRNRLRRQLARFLHAATRHLERAGKPQVADAILARARAADPALGGEARFVVG